MSTAAATSLDNREPIEKAKLLQAERAIEIQHVHNRDQWFWVSFTTCLAGSVVALASSNSPAIFIGVPGVLFLLNLYLSRIFHKSIKISLEALTERHNTFVNLVDRAPCLQELSFAFRKPRKEPGLQGQEYIVDEAHLEANRYTLKATFAAPFSTFALFTVGVVHYFFKP